MTILYDFPGNNRRLYELFSHFILFRILFFSPLFFVSSVSFCAETSQQQKWPRPMCLHRVPVTTTCMYIYIYCDIYSPSSCPSVHVCLYFSCRQEKRITGETIHVGSSLLSLLCTAFMRYNNELLWRRWQRLEHCRLDFRFADRDDDQKQNKLTEKEKGLVY
jgi:hypothetical protein